MTRIMLELDDDTHLAPMLDVLASLSFVRRISRLPDADDASDPAAGGAAGGSDFFSLAGLWQGREICKEGIRAAAWPERPLR